jgi:hypothetical protein
MVLFRFIFVILTGVLVFGCSNSSLTDHEIDQILNTIASWANSNAVTVSINDLSLNSAGPNAGGCSPVYWDNPLDAGDVAEHRENLSLLFGGSSCDKDAFIESVSGIESSSSQGEVTAILECLGEVEFEQVECGPQ